MVFFEHQYYFSIKVLERFKPSHVYAQCRQREFGSTSHVLAQDLDSIPDPATCSTTLRRSTHPS